MSETKQSNPKDLIGASKLPLHLWPETATAYGCLGLLDGALKYGRGNFRAVGVRSSIYYDAARRHLNAWFEGQDNDLDSGLPHLSHALACLAILVDAIEANKLNDDRQYPGGYLNTVKKLTPHVERLKQLRADAQPEQHYIIHSATNVHWRHAWEYTDEEKQQGLTELCRRLQLIADRNDDLTHEDAEGDPNYWGADATGWRKE